MRKLIENPMVIGLPYPEPEFPEEELEEDCGPEEPDYDYYEDYYLELDERE